MPGQQVQRRRRKSEPRVQPTKLPTVSFSSRSDFKRCHWKWYLGYVEKWSPALDAPPLRFGTLIHQALAAYYKPGRKRGPKPWLTFARLYEEQCKLQESFGFRVQDDEKWMDAGDLGDAMLRNYVEHYTSGVPAIPDDEIEVVCTEKRFEIVIYKPWTYDSNYPPEAQKTAEPWFRFVGVIDNIWRHIAPKRPKLYLVDHKTAAAINPKYLALDQQSTGYWTFGLDWLYQEKLLSPDERLDGILFNILRKAKKDERPRNDTGQYLNKDGSISKSQPPPYFARVPIMRDVSERDRLRERILVEYEDIERVREGGIELAYKNESQFSCPGCWLFDICELHEIGLDWQGMAENTVKDWDPTNADVIYEMETR